MTGTRWAAMALMVGCLLGGAWGQAGGVGDGGEVYRDSALEHGPLVVWWVVRATARDKAVIEGRKLAATAGPPQTSVEKTMGEFGEASSNVGQTSGSYGQTASSLGKPASDVGKNAGNVGETAGNFGRTSSSVGQTAGSYGQSASSLGQDASSYGESIAQASVPVPLPGQMKMSAVVNVPRRQLVDALRESYPGIEVRVVDVLDVELRERLERAQGTGEFPDTVVGVENLPWWKGSGFGMTMLGVPSALERPSRATELRPQYEARFVTILKQAKHMAAAKAFVVWIRDEGLCAFCGSKQAVDVPGEVKAAAESAVTSVLGGGALGGEADPEAAKFDAGEAQWMALGSSRGLAPGEIEATKVQMKLVNAAVDGPLAVADVRSVLSGENSFGVTHSLVVLRKSEGVWRVLQVSPNMWVGRLTDAEALLAAALGGRIGGSGVKGVSLASPVDGDNRQPEPELWWDNKGGAALEAVEWQLRTGGGWTSSHLEMVPDTASRLQTRVVARFADLPTTYRWRVWAVGGGGSVVLSEWRTFVVLGK